MTDLRHRARAAGFKRTLSLFPHQPLSATTLFHFDMKAEIYIRQLGPIFGAHEGFLKRCSDVQPTNQPSEKGLSTFFHSVMTESFHRISGKSWKSRPDGGDSKAPTTPLTFSSSAVVSQHIWPSLGWQNLHMNMEEISFNHNMLVRMCDMKPRILKISIIHHSDKVKQCNLRRRSLSYCQFRLKHSNHNPAARLRAQASCMGHM